LKIGCLSIVARIVPERAWARCCLGLASLTGWLSPKVIASHISDIRLLLGEYTTGKDPEDIVRERRAEEFMAHLHILASRRNKGWQPKVLVIGLENLTKALDLGHGAILWVNNFTHFSLVTKKALSDAGFDVTHLSRAGHGFSPTPFARRFLNPIWCEVENRYLSERVIICDDDTNIAACMQALDASLRQNGIVSITVGPWAKTLFEIPFLAGRLRLPYGPSNIALKTKAQLLPVFTLRKSSGEFEVHIESRLQLSGHTTQQECIESQLVSFA